MTISSTLRRAGPFLGNGVTVAFPFTFKVFSKTDVLVTLTDEAGVETELVLDSDYSVTLSPNQDTAPGGTVSYPISGAPLPINRKLTLSGDLPYSQTADIQNQGGFYPQVIEAALDRIVVQAQQLAEELSRTVKVNISDPTPPDELFNTVLARANASADAAAQSATDAQSAEENAAGSAALAQSWAVKMDGMVSGTDYSAKYYAQMAQQFAGVQAFDTVPTALSTKVIEVVGIGRMSWNGTRYMPDRRPPGYRFGGLMTHASTTVTVAAGEWRDSANGVDLVLASAITKTIQASGAWAAGNNQNGLFSGARANSTWYEVFVIVNDSTGAVDVGFDTNATAANRPAGWTAYQLVGSVYVDGTGTIKPFLNPALREFVWVQRTQDVNGGPASDASVGTAVTLAVPVRRRVVATIGVWLDASNPANVVSISSVDAVPSTVGTGGALGDVFRAASPTAHFNTLEVLTSNSAQIIAKAGSGGAITAALSVGTRGWRELF